MVVLLLKGSFPWACCVLVWWMSVCVVGQGGIDVQVQIEGVAPSYSESQLSAVLAVSNMSVLSYNDQNVSLAQAQCPTGSYCPSDST